jgi:hypothetical protein
MILILRGRIAQLTKEKVLENSDSCLLRLDREEMYLQYKWFNATSEIYLKLLILNFDFNFNTFPLFFAY